MSPNNDSFSPSTNLNLSERNHSFRSSNSKPIFLIQDQNLNFSSFFKRRRSSSKATDRIKWSIFNERPSSEETTISFSFYFNFNFTLERSILFFCCRAKLRPIFFHQNLTNSNKLIRSSLKHSKTLSLLPSDTNDHTIQA